MANTYGTFTSEVLTAAMLNTAGGGWTDHSGSVTFTNFTLGNGTINTCRYEQIGRSVKYEVKVTLGGSSSVSGQIGVSLPKTAARSHTARWPAYIVDAGTRAFDDGTLVGYREASFPVLDTLRDQGLPQAVAKLRALFGSEPIW